MPYLIVRVVHSYRDSNEFNSLLTKLSIMIWKLYDNKGLWGLANEKVVGKKGPNAIMTQQENAHPNLSLKSTLVTFPPFTFAFICQTNKNKKEF